MDYAVMTTKKLLALQSTFEDQINEFVGMSFMSSRSDSVSYEIDSVDSDEVLITVNHFFNGLIRDYTVKIFGSIDDDVEYNRYNADEEIIDGGYMSFDRLQKDVRNAVIEIYTLYKNLEEINNILDTRLDTHDYEEEPEEEKPEEKPEEKTEEKTEEKPEEKDNGAYTMNRIDVYNAYAVNRDFRYIANALNFRGFDYNHEDDDFRTELENDDELGDLLEQLEDVEASQFLIYTCTKVKFYERHEYDILSYLRAYGYGDNDNLQSIEEIMCSRVIAYVTGVISEYVY